MKVTTTKAGFFGKLRQIGETFEVPDGTRKASWFEQVAKPKAEPKPKAEGKPGDESLA